MGYLKKAYYWYKLHMLQRALNNFLHEAYIEGKHDRQGIPISAIEGTYICHLFTLASLIYPENFNKALEQTKKELGVTEYNNEVM